MKWNNSHKNPPKSGDTVYYFGPNIGLWVGKYEYKPNFVTHQRTGKPIELCPHLFTPINNWGIVDACDAPWWAPYDPENESKGWRPIIPENYTRDLYDNNDDEIHLANVDPSHLTE